jgi:hypothetical protein
MYRFLSAIGFRNGNIICNPSINSYEDLLNLHELKESKLKNWIKLEFYPNTNTYYDINSYELHINDNITNWITNELKSKWIKKLTQKLKKIIITKDTDILTVGIYILNNVYINIIENCTILHMYNSVIKHIWDNSVIKHIWDNSVIENMYNDSVIEYMFNNSVIKNIYDDSIVKHMFNNSVIKNMYDYSVIEYTFNNSIIENIHNNSVIKNMYNSSIIKNINDNSVIENNFTNH